MPAIVTESLTKFYGKTRGVEQLDLVVEPGEVFGFLGPNGAGKSTTIRLLLDFIRPTAGRSIVLGLDTRSASVEINRRVGYVPGELAMYDKMTAREMLRYFASLRGMMDLGDAESVAERLELNLDMKIRAYSSGNRRKVALAQAFMHRPELLILDEPTSALDPLVQLEFYRMVDEVRAEGRTVFLSSHVLHEVERIADRVGIIRQGRLVIVDTVSAIKDRATRHLELRFAGPVDPAVFERLDNVDGVHLIDHGTAVRVTVTGSVDAVIKAAAGYETTSVVADGGDLEDAFLSYYSEAPDAE